MVTTENKHKRTIVYVNLIKFFSVKILFNLLEQNVYLFK